jgi:hypothetical protein
MNLSFANFELAHAKAKITEKRELLNTAFSNPQLPIRIGWGGGIRTPAYPLQRRMPYHLATPQCIELGYDTQKGRDDNPFRVSGACQTVFRRMLYSPYPSLRIRGPQPEVLRQGNKELAGPDRSNRFTWMDRGVVLTPRFFAERRIR